MVLLNVIAYLTANFEYAKECQSFFNALQGCMAVRNGANKEGKLYWFHAFMMGIFLSFSGGSFGTLWLGKPTSMLSNDVNIACCILAFILVNYVPFSIGYKLANTFPVVLATTCFAQLFRSSGLISYCSVAFETFKGNPSEYYPIPVFGPIIYASLLGNMGGFFNKGFTGHLQKGMPWSFQTGLACATFYHFYVHDETGFVGIHLRHCFHLVFDDFLKISGLDNLDRATLAFVFVSAFQQIMAILQLPYFLGPSANPFNALYYFVPEETPAAKPKALQKNQESSPSNTGTKESNTAPDSDNNGTKKKKKKKKKAAQQKDKDL